MIFIVMIILLSALLVVGIVKPEWTRFGQKHPGRATIIAVATGLLLIGLFGVDAIQYTGKNTEVINHGKMLSEAMYAVTDHAPRCDPRTKPGSAGSNDNEKTSMGIRYMVKTPVNYNSSIAHPLLMVYAPAGKTRYASEDFVHLTQDATAAGFIVAYTDHLKMTPETIEELGEIPRLIEMKWCVDKKRVFLTGHSDGGTTAMGIAFMKSTKHIPAAIAPSAVGIRGEDLQEYRCPNPLPVMIMHSSHDTLFPGYGRETIQWWAACNGCGAAAPVKDADGCVTYRSCKDDVTTRYCEGTGTHSEWPEQNKAMIDFFRSCRDVR
jgi:polyhydroxybutyrate depolymerase